MINTHKSKDGRETPISEMHDAHLINTIKQILMRSDQGVDIKRGTMEAEYIDVLFEGEALEHLNFQSYVNEAKSRGLEIEGITTAEEKHED